MKYTLSVIICAAGKGARAGFEKNKLLVPFQGSTALEKSIDAFDFDAIDEIVVAASLEDFEEISTLFDDGCRIAAKLLVPHGQRLQDEGDIGVFQQSVALVQNFVVSK